MYLCNLFNFYISYYTDTLLYRKITVGESRCMIYDYLLYYSCKFSQGLKLFKVKNIIYNKCT